MSVDHPMLARASKNFEGLYMKSMRAHLGFQQLYSELLQLDSESKLLPPLNCTVRLCLAHEHTM